VTGEAVETAHYERSDISVVPAAGVIGEAMVLLTLTAAVLEKFGGDSLAEVQHNLARYVERITARPEAGGDRSVGGRRPGAEPVGPRGTSAGPGSGGAGPGSGVAGSGGDD
jgi:chorismate synthase